MINPFDFHKKNFHPSQSFLISATAFIAGIALASFLETDWRQWELWFFGAVLGFLIPIIFWRRFPVFFLAGLLGLFLFMGLWRYSWSGPAFDPGRIDNYQGQKIEVSGSVAREPERRSGRQLLKVAAESIILPGQTEDLPASGRFLVYARPFPELNYGDRVRLECRPEPAEAIEDFRYDRFLAKSGIYSLCFYPKIQVLERGGGNFFLANIYRFKALVGRELDRNLGPGQAALARAMVLGDKGRLSDQQKEVFGRSGLAHLMAISGLHIGIISIMMLEVLVWAGLWRRQAFYGVTVLLFLYLLLIGFPPSALRAGLLAWLVLLAYHVRRLSDSGPLLLAAAIFTLAVNPRLLRDDIGWQLSFTAVAGIIYIFPLLEAWARQRRIPEKWQIRSIVLMTLAVQLATWPIVAGSFGTFALYAPAANLLALPPLPFALSALLAGIGLSWLPDIASLLFFWPARAALMYLDAVAAFISALPGASLGIVSAPAYLFLFYYGSLAVLVRVWRRRLDEADLIYF